MKKNQKSLCRPSTLSLVVLLIFLFHSNLPLTAQSTKKKDDKILKDAMVSGMTLGIPGMSVAIGHKNELIWAGTEGYSDILKKTPVKTDDKFGIGSITKTFVARVILQLAEEGKIDLNKTATDYVQLPIVKRVPNADKASILHLINHQSGVPTWEFDTDWIRDGRGDQMDLKHLWGKTETLKYVTGDKAKADFSPGEAYAYSNTNYTLLGLIIEAVTGNDLMTEIRNRIFEPLQLNQVFMESFEDIPGGFVNHYHFSTPAFEQNAGVHDKFKEIRPYVVESTPANLSPEWAAGGMVASASNLVRWAQAIKNGELLGEKMQKEVFTFHPPTKIGNPNHKYLQGVSCFLNYFGGETIYGHSGGTLGFTAYMFWLEQHDVTIVLLTNIGRMHSEVNPSPVSIFYKDVLVPAVLEYVKE